jgi:hypothetical protein
MPKLSTTPFNELRRKYEISLARCELDIVEKDAGETADAACNRQDARNRKIFAAIKSANPPINQSEAVDLLTIADLAMGDHHDEELVRPMIQKALAGLDRLSP